MKKRLILYFVLFLVLLVMPFISAQSSCGPGFSDPASFFEVKNIVSTRFFNITASFDCGVDYVELSRCDGICSSSGKFNAITTLSSSSINFVDKSNDLAWGSNYTYKIVAKYTFSGLSVPKFAGVYSGDVECSDSRKVFCSNNKAWSCNNNKLVKPALLDCSSQLNTICVSDGFSASCRDGVDCASFNSQPFGLYSNKSVCENFGRNFCFYDKSKTIVNKCYDCDAKMSCYDYKSSDACLSDNCGVGNCGWKDLIPGLGVGVCSSSVKSNCEWCDKSGSGFVDSNEAFNVVFDSCSQDKADLLSGIDNCFVDLQAPQKTGRSCLNVDCSSYTQAQCGSDPCGIGVCDWDGSAGCVKNFAGKPKTINWWDCFNKPDKASCERDYFAPETSGFVVNNNGTASRIFFSVFDKVNASDVGSYKSGYKINFCVVDVNNPANCNDLSNFKQFNDVELFVNNQELLDKNNVVLFKLNNGLNDLKFFSVDLFENNESVKSISFTACSGCSGPVVTSFDVSNGQKVGGVWYSRDKRPNVSINFTVPSSLIQYDLKKATSSIPVSVNPSSGVSNNFVINPLQDLDGEYLLSVNAKTQANIPMASGVFERLIVDSVNPFVVSSLANNVVVNQSKVDVLFAFSEPVIIKKAVISEEVFVGDFESEFFDIDLINDLVPSLDKRNFTHSPSKDFKDGRHLISVVAEDFAGNNVSLSSVFFVSTKPLMIKLNKPVYGSSSNNVFNLEFETSVPTFCQYVFNHPFVLNPDIRKPIHQSFDSSNNVLHVLNSFNKISVENKKYSLQVFCDDNKAQGRVSTKVFSLEVDKFPLNIISKIVVPSVVAEKELSGFYEADVEVKTNKPGFCKFDDSNVNFDAMKNSFSTHQTNKARNVHVATIKVPNVGNYSYFVYCKGVAGILSSLDIVGFIVDPLAPFGVSSRTPLLVGNSSFNLLFDSNKRAVCYYSDDAKKQKTQVDPSGGGSSSWLKSHFQLVDVSNKLSNGVGSVKYFISCFDKNSSKADAEMSVFVDTTPPEMSFVDSKTPNALLDPGSPFKTWENTRFRSAFKGEDADSGVDYYEYRLYDPYYLNASDPSRNAFTDPSQPVIDWTISRVLDGSKVIITQDHLGRALLLNNNSEYVFEVRAVNKAGLKSEVMSDVDPVLIDTSLNPPSHCSNFFKDGDEVDEDCGGSCKPCGVGKFCNIDNDCDSKLCVSNVCAQPSCDDAFITLGFESDKGCGGSCALCDVGRKCLTSSDCVSNNCAGGVCELPVPCYDKVEKCGLGEGCRSNSDCQANAKCMSNVCVSFNDGDLDGVSNDNDSCPGTKRDKRVDVKGCALCDDDINDSWRERYFGSVDCTDADQLASSDPDNDGLINLDEFNQNTDPLVIDKKPVPVWLYWVVSSIILVLLIVAGFFGYKKLVVPYFERKKLKEFEAVKIVESEKKEDIKESISKLREIAKEKKDEPEFIPLSDLPEKIRRTPEMIFSKLKNIARKK